MPVVVFIDEVAELFFTPTKDARERVERMSMTLIRLAQLGRAAGVHLEVCGQRFGSELGKGATMLRAQLTGRVCHRVNDTGTAEMALGDISAQAVAAATQIPAARPCVAVVASDAGDWQRARTPLVSLDRAREVTAEHAHLTPALPELADFRPVSEDAAPAVIPAQAGPEPTDATTDARRF